MAPIKTFVNGGSLLPSDLDNMELDYEGAFAYLKVLKDASTRLDAPTSGGPYLLGGGSTGAGVAAAGATAGLSVFYLDPADFKESEVNERLVKYKLLSTLLTNATAPTITFTVGLYPVTAAAGSEQVVSITLGSVVAGSTCVFTTPAHESLTVVRSTVFTAPSAGFFALACAVSGSAAAKSSAAIRATLQMSQI